MLEKSKTRITWIIAGVIIGGIIGSIIFYTDEAMFFTIPGLQQIFTAIPLPLNISLTAFGMIIGGIIGYFIPVNHPHFSRVIQNDVKIPLREEQLDIEKTRKKTVDVDIHKEVIKDEQTVTVPVSREELVVDKTALDNDKETETIRIPLSKERIEINKEPVKLNDVSVYNKQIHGKETVEETLKKEMLALDTEGDAKAIDKKSDN